jgi:hypothetical protein
MGNGSGGWGPPQLSGTGRDHAGILVFVLQVVFPPSYGLLNKKCPANEYPWHLGWGEPSGDSPQYQTPWASLFIKTKAWPWKEGP